MTVDEQAPASGGPRGPVPPGGPVGPADPDVPSTPATDGRGTLDLPAVAPVRRGTRWGLFTDFGARLTTSGPGVELGLVRAFAGLRAVNVLQAGLAVAFLYQNSQRPWLAILSYLVFVAESVAVVTVLLRRRTVRVPQIVGLDVVSGVLFLLVQPHIAQPRNLVGSWNAWGWAVTLSCALLAGMALRHRPALLSVGALSLTYVLASRVGVVNPYVLAGHEGNINQNRLWTLVANTFDYSAFWFVGSTLSAYLRRLGEASEIGLRLARIAGAEHERERARHLLHDHASLLAEIGRSADTRPLQAQARAGANEVAAYLATPVGDPPERSAGTVADVVRRAATPFADLPLTLTVILAQGATLDADSAAALRGAVTTLLHNVRVHAEATSVVVHADASDDGASWEVTVVDDGVGFDPATTPRGFGLARQVVRAAELVGIEVQVRSGPGEGTMVRLVGSAARARAASAAAAAATATTATTAPTAPSSTDPLDPRDPRDPREPSADPESPEPEGRRPV